MNWAKKLEKEYRITKNDLEQYRKKLDRDDPRWEQEYELVSSMIADMQFALYWLKHGRRPGSRKGAEKRNVYQIVFWSKVFQDVTANPDLERELIELLCLLSDRERECFLLHMARGLTLAEIADKLKISKRTAQQYVNRAKQKIMSRYPSVMTYL